MHGENTAEVPRLAAGDTLPGTESWNRAEIPEVRRIAARDGAPLTYRLYPGRADRAVVLVHGSSGSSISMHKLAQALQQAPPGSVPPVVAFLAGHAQLFFLGFMLVSIATLVCATGLLRRRNWARLGFVGLMGLGIAWQAVGFWLQSNLMSTMREQFAAAAELGGPDFGAAAPAIMLVGAIFALGMAALQGWIAWKLLTPAIAAEFRQ